MSNDIPGMRYTMESVLVMGIPQVIRFGDLINAGHKVDGVSELEVIRVLIDRMKRQVVINPGDRRLGAALERLDEARCHLLMSESLREKEGEF